MGAEQHVAPTIGMRQTEGISAPATGQQPYAWKTRAGVSASAVHQVKLYAVEISRIFHAAQNWHSTFSVCALAHIFAPLFASHFFFDTF
jgi:hypothetical protein